MTEPTISGRINNLDPEPRYLKRDVVGIDMEAQTMNGRKPIVVITGNSAELTARLAAIDFSVLEERAMVVIDSYPDVPDENPADTYAKMYGFPMDHPHIERMRKHMDEPIPHIPIRDLDEQGPAPDNRKSRRAAKSKKGPPINTPSGWNRRKNWR